MKPYDFSGWATKNDLLCADGRIIKKDAFKECDGNVVPLVWNHDHNNPENVLGHAVLENRDNGVYAYCSFNDTETGQRAKKIVEHGDVKSLSIWANKLIHQGSSVVHGAIREVSLVLAGANPGAFIENVISHGENCDDEMILCVGDDLSFWHSDEESSKTVKEETVENEVVKTEEKERYDNGMQEKEIKHSEKEKETTVKDVIDTMTEEQKNVMYGLIGQALEEGRKEETEEDEENNMKHNLFENEEQDETLVHSEEFEAALNDAKRYGSLKESFLQHGITNIDYLYPDAKNLTNTPGFIDIHPKEWVKVIMDGVHHTPFSRIKMMFADITNDEARAKGYIKGNYKLEETISLLKRTVTPTTVYKKQKLDRDDVIDITDFDVVAWLKKEMRMKLDEELARAFIFGDGRSSASDDKINESNIIPVAKDTTNNLYAMVKEITVPQGTYEATAVIDGIVKAFDDYEGSGNTVALLKQGLVTDMILTKDGDGYRMYKDMGELAAAMTVNRIVKVPASVMNDNNLYGVILDLNDYNVGADKGGAVNMFDDFDIDYNAQKYLIETRCSGALTVPHSAIVLKKHTD